MLFLTRWRRVFTPTTSVALRLYHMSSPASSVGQSAPKMADKQSLVESFPPPKELLTPLRVPQKTLLGPGPSNASPRVLAASALPLLGHLHPEFLQGIEYHKPCMFFICHGESSAGVLQPLDGIGDICHKHDCLLLVDSVASLGGTPLYMDEQGAEVRTMNKPIGQNFTLEDIQKGIEYHKPCMFFICHGESSAGVLQPLDGIGDICHKHDCLLLVDSVASLGGTPLYMDEQGIDILYSGAQKVLGAPPGASPISFSARARGKLARRKQKVPSFYFDMNLLSDYWGVGLQKGQPRKYSIEISGGLGASAGKAWRIGLMGHNCTRDNVELVLRSLKDALQHYGVRIQAKL
uniref:Alanine--glyoxylate aminotransferase n=1 Tax=Branchiostoma floridae TaxID=7739 RepID=C3XPW2_BRAFL|eukprot:XP_002613974.1 hypothetical protein BRAFLDRAFT_67460 [Branchiostoma floridae]